MNRLIFQLIQQNPFSVVTYLLKNILTYGYSTTLVGQVGYLI